MNQPTMIGRLLSPAGFGLTLLLFLLPFLTVSCGAADDRVTGTFSGMDMLIGGEPDVAARGTETEVREAQQGIVAIFADQLDAEPLAILAALTVLAAMAVGMVRERLARHAASMGLAVLAVALLTAAILRATRHINDALRTVSDAPTGWDVRIRYGFWLCVGLLGALAVGHAVALARAWRAPPSPVPADPGDPPEVEVTSSEYEP